jgi:putative peptidoglycan lipid II flippase
LTASRIPRVFFDAIFASAIAASFIPVFSEFMTKRGKREALDFSGNFITVISFLSLALTVLGLVFTEPLVRLFADGYDAATAALCVSLTRIMFPTVFFTGIAFCFVGILQSFDEFNIPSLISVLANAIIIIYYYTFNSRYGIYGLAVAFLIAWFMQAAVQVPSLKKRGFYFKPSLRFRSDGMKKVLALMLPVMVSTLVQPINLTINTKFGSRLFNGAGVSAIELSNNLYLIIIGVFILSVTNVIFPRLSRMSAENENEQFKATISRTIQSSMFFVIPMTAGVFVLAKPVIALIYGGGEFDAFSIGITSDALRWISLGMVGYALQAIVSRAYFARQNGRTPLVAGGVSIAVNLLLCVLLTEPLGVTGLAVASAAAGTVNAAVLLLPLRKAEGRILSKKQTADLVKMIFASVVMAVAVWPLMTALDGRLSGTLGYAVTAAVPAAVGILVYIAVTALLKVAEAKETFMLLGRLIGRVTKKGV